MYLYIVFMACIYVSYLCGWVFKNKNFEEKHHTTGKRVN